MTTPEGNRWTYAYDPFGRRIRKTGPEEETEFVWDRYDIIHERRQKKVRTWIYDEYSYRLLAQIENNRFYAVISDHLGTPRELVHAGRIAWRGNNWAWGERIGSGEAADVSCPWIFPGQYEDAESGLYFNCFRYYDPVQGRYLSPDPFEILGGLNEYSYCRNPANWIDPLGLCKKEYVYVLKDKDGKIVYIGITNNPKVRARQHGFGKKNKDGSWAVEPKEFTKMEVITDKLTHNQARNLEANLIAEQIQRKGVNTDQHVDKQLQDAGLQNKNRGRVDNTPPGKEQGTRGARAGDPSLIKDQPTETHPNPNPKTIA
jgi:RHS repeat-associated protein